MVKWLVRIVVVMVFGVLIWFLPSSTVHVVVGTDPYDAADLMVNGNGDTADVKRNDNVHIQVKTDPQIPVEIWIYDSDTGATLYQGPLVEMATGRYEVSVKIDDAFRETKECWAYVATRPVH